MKVGVLYSRVRIEEKLLFEELDKRVRVGLHLCLLHDLPGCIDDAHARQFQRDINCGIVLHGCTPVCVAWGPAPNTGTPFTNHSGDSHFSFKLRQGPLRHLIGSSSCGGTARAFACSPNGWRKVSSAGHALPTGSCVSRRGQLSALLEGLDFFRVHPRDVVRPTATQ